MKIRLCEHNPGAEKLVQQLRDYCDGLDIKAKKCAKQCKLCRSRSLALVDKQLVTAATPEALQALLQDMIDRAQGTEG